MKTSELGLKIRRIRELSGRSREELAKACNIAPRTLAKLECGEIDDVRLSTIIRISEALGMPLSTLVADTEAEEYPEDERIIRRNYRDREPYYDISTFVELALALPVLDYRLLIDACQRIGGDIVGNETYAEKQFQFALDHSLESPAKQYVIKVLNIIHEITAGLGENMTMTEFSMLFYDAVSAEKCSDPDFEKDYEAYIENIETRKTVEMLTRNAFEEIKKLRYDATNEG